MSSATASSSAPAPASCTTAIPEKEYVEVGNKLGALFQAIKKINTLEKQNVFTDR